MDYVILHEIFDDVSCNDVLVESLIVFDVFIRFNFSQNHVIQVDQRVVQLYLVITFLTLARVYLGIYALCGIYIAF